jgi:hypothetical protein
VRIKIIKLDTNRHAKRAIAHRVRQSRRRLCRRHASTAVLNAVAIATILLYAGLVVVEVSHAVAVADAAIPCGAPLMVAVVVVGGSSAVAPHPYLSGGAELPHEGAVAAGAAVPVLRLLLLFW